MLVRRRAFRCPPEHREFPYVPPPVRWNFPGARSKVRRSNPQTPQAPLSNFHEAEGHETVSTIAEPKPVFAADLRSESLPAPPRSRDLPASAKAGDRKSPGAPPEGGRLPVAFFARTLLLPQPSPPIFSWRFPDSELPPGGPDTQPPPNEQNSPQIRLILEAALADRHAHDAPYRASPPCALPFADP